MSSSLSQPSDDTDSSREEATPPESLMLTLLSPRREPGAVLSISATQLSQLMVIHVSTGNQVLNKCHLINSCSAPTAEWAKKHKQWWLRLGSQCKEEEQWRLTAMGSRWREKTEGEACACCAATQQPGEANADLPEKATGLSTRSLVWWPWMETGSHYLA